ncbi:MAG: bifunctional demethylmenaquinone methyltransferase/2-methoxy-6-polyprenyl-1,4-benzoquinol methylase UbiE [Bacteroidales bacterium]|nr:bifunctional demethylmenaquinone methyltransferase/2-methoxy-6-polyprenyl-1,4-benzoquinol methylase UbiE [Bacteroidales bacterium]
MAYDFDTIARDYDRMNRLMTLGLDCRWRKRAVRELSTFHFPLSTLDVACGTGDMVVELMKHGCTVIGVDLSEEMMAIARQKAPTATYMIADAEHLPFEDNSFDVVTCAFGVRNFVHLEQGLGEMLRVLKPGGRMVILELATPDSVVVRPFYNLYTRRLIPLLGKWLAGSREAYTYLPRSIERFPKGKDFLAVLEHVGVRASERKMTFGVCREYVAVKD